MSQVFYTGISKMAFLWFKLQVGLAKTIKNLSQMVKMLLETPGKNCVPDKASILS